MSRHRRRRHDPRGQPTTPPRSTTTTALRQRRDRRHPRPARARVPGELVGVSQAHPAARRRASRHRRRPSRLRRLRSRAADYTSAFAAESLRQLIEDLDLGPVHLTGQDIGGISTFRLAAGHPELIRSYAAIETGLPGFGLEMLADVTHGGTWHIGVLAAPGIPEMLLTGRERDFLAGYAYPAMSATEGAISEQDIDEFTRAYRAPGRLPRRHRPLPLHAQGGRGDSSRSSPSSSSDARPRRRRGHRTVHLRHHGPSRWHVSQATLDGIGHLAAIDDPEALAQTLLGFYRRLDA